MVYVMSLLVTMGLSMLVQYFLISARAMVLSIPHQAFNVFVNKTIKS